jgi:hypothetical protein
MEVGLGGWGEEDNTTALPLVVVGVVSEESPPAT